MITLTVVSGPAAGATCTKDSSSAKAIKVGRVKTGNALVIKDDQVSSRHLEVTWTDGSWFALDLGSTNGTKLNESQVRMMEDQRYKLRDGDQLFIGTDTVLQVQIQDADAAAAEEGMTVEQKLTVDTQRLAASIQAAAAAAQKELRQEWAGQRQLLTALVTNT